MRNRTWFTSDWHLGHQNIIEFCDRPFVDVHHMGAELTANYFRQVAPGDDVYFVGDMVMGSLEVGLETIERLPGNKFLVPGNHDKVWRGRKNWERFLPAYEDAGFTVLESEAVVNIGDRPVRVCHFPYAGVAKEHGYDDKFSGNRPIDDGSWLICGHIHQNWTVKDRMINVGVDVWDFQLVPDAWIAAIIEEGEVT